MKSEKLTALGLSACMIFSTVYVPVIEAGAAEELESGELSDDTLEVSESEGTEETADASAEGVDESGNVGEPVRVDANDSGVYTVTITKENLIYDEEIAERIPELVTAEDAVSATEMNRELLLEEEAPADFAEEELWEDSGEVYDAAGEAYDAVGEV